MSGYANLRVKPRKALLIFIEGLFQVAMKIIKGFQNMGTDVKFLSAACKLYSTSCISSFAPLPCSCNRQQKNHTGFIYPSACGIYIPIKPIAFQELRSYLTSHPSISFYFHFMHTPQHRTASVVFFLSSSGFIHAVSHYPSYFPTHFQQYVFIFCGELAPIGALLASNHIVWALFIVFLC